MPHLADLNGDGNIDLIVGDDTGSISVYERMSDQSFVDTNLFGGIYFAFDAAPILADLDGDGDLDLVVGTHWSVINVYEQVAERANS